MHGVSSASSIHHRNEKVKKGQDPCEGVVLRDNI